MIPCLRPRIALRGAGPVAVALLALLATAPAALATNIRYEVPTSPAYSQESEDETRTIDYGGCVAAGEAQTLQVRVTSSIFSEASPATFQVSSEEGVAPAVTVSPPTVQIAPESVQTFDVVVSFTLAAPTTEGTTFRVRLVPDSGEEVRDGSGGLRVRIACVTAPTVSAAPTPRPRRPRSPRRRRTASAGSCATRASARGGAGPTPRPRSSQASARTAAAPCGRRLPASSPPRGRARLVAAHRFSCARLAFARVSARPSASRCPTSRARPRWAPWSASPAPASRSRA